MMGGTAVARCHYKAELSGALGIGRPGPDDGPSGTGHIDALFELIEPLILLFNFYELINIFFIFNSIGYLRSNSSGIRHWMASPVRNEPMAGTNEKVRRFRRTYPREVRRYGMANQHTDRRYVRRTLKEAMLRAVRAPIRRPQR
jgi:hypothetical protein